MKPLFLLWASLRHQKTLTLSLTRPMSRFDAALLLLWGRSKPFSLSSNHKKTKKWENECQYLVLYFAVVYGPICSNRFLRKTYWFDRVLLLYFLVDRSKHLWKKLFPQGATHDGGQHSFSFVLLSLSPSLSPSLVRLLTSLLSRDRRSHPHLAVRLRIKACIPATYSSRPQELNLLGEKIPDRVTALGFKLTSHGQKVLE